MSEVIVVTSGKGVLARRRPQRMSVQDLPCLGKSNSDRYRYRSEKPRRGDGTGEPHRLQPCGRRGGNCRLKQALIKDKRYPNLFLLPSAQTRDKSSVTPGQMRKLVDDLREEFDYVLLDCPAGIEQGFKNAIAGADRAFVVTTPEVSAIRDADRIIGLLEAEEISKMDLIVNRIRMDMVRRGI